MTGFLHNDFRFLLLLFARFFLADGERQGHGRAVINDAICANFPMMTAHIGLADAEAEAGAASALGGEERLEDVSENVSRDAAIRVGHAHLDHIDVRQSI